MRSRAVVFAAALVLAPLGVQGADLVVWWDEGSTRRRTRPSGRSSRPSSSKTGKRVELVLHPAQELPDKLPAAVEAGRAARLRIRHRQHRQLDPGMGLTTVGSWISRTPSGHFSNLFDPDALACVRLLNGTTGQAWPLSLPMGFATHHVHVWKSLLERAGFTLADIPREWEAFWAFWCDQVQPAVRRATGPRRHLGRRPYHVGQVRQTRIRFDQFLRRLRGRLRDPRRPAGHRRSRGPAQAHQGDRQLHDDLSQGLHPARFGRHGTTAATTRRSWRRRSS